MATTYTSLWRLAILATADPATQNSWGTIQSATMSLMEQGAVGITQVSIGGLTSYSLTTANNASDQARYLVQQYTGALSSPCTVTLPNLAKIGWATNDTTGGQNVILTSGAGTNATIPPNGCQYLFSTDGGGNTALIPVGLGQGNVGSLNVAGNAGVGGALNVSGDAALNGSGTALQVPNGLASFNIIQTNGSTSDSGLNGWNFDTTGANPVTGGVIPIGAVFSNSYALAGGYFATSDKRLKDDIVAITPRDGESFVKAARPVSYVKHGTKEAGFLAQDQIQDGFGHLVIATPHKGMPAFDEGGLHVAEDHALSLNYDNYIAYLTASNQGLYEENRSLRDAFRLLTIRVAALEEAV